MFDYIDTDVALQAYLDKVQDAEWIVMDTEFIREKTYYPRLCLIQIATEDTLICVDPLSIDDLSAFFTWINDPARIKILHAAFQDLEIFFHLSGQVPSPIFDSQIAAAVLGLGDQMGYARLVESQLGIQLDKSQSRTDWSRRPLQDAQLSYAIDDVRYLREIYPSLLKQLQDLGRLDWLDKPFQRLTDATLFAPSPRDIWMRVKGLNYLKPRQLAVLRELAAWREEAAMERDIPRKWVLSDEVLLDLAKIQPKGESEMQSIRGLNPDRIKRRAKQWLALIEVGQQVPEDEWPVLARRRKLDAHLGLVADLLMVVVTQQAQAHNISPQMIATRKQVEKMLSEGRTSLSDDWRGSLVNDVFAKLLAGDAGLKINDHQVVISAD